MNFCLLTMIVGVGAQGLCFRAVSREELFEHFSCSLYFYSCFSLLGTIFLRPIHTRQSQDHLLSINFVMKIVYSHFYLSSIWQILYL